MACRVLGLVAGRELGDGSLSGQGSLVTVTALVYRPGKIATDVFGDPVDDNGEVIRPESPHTYLGTLPVVLSGVQSELIEPRLTGSGGGSVDRAEASDISGMVGAPRDAAFKLRHGDRLVVTDTDGISLTYQVSGLRQFDWANSLNPSWNGHRLYWMAVAATDG